MDPNETCYDILWDKFLHQQNLQVRMELAKSNPGVFAIAILLALLHPRAPTGLVRDSDFRASAAAITNKLLPASVLDTMQKIGNEIYEYEVEKCTARFAERQRSVMRQELLSNSTKTALLRGIGCTRLNDEEVAGAWAGVCGIKSMASSKGNKPQQWVRETLQFVAEKIISALPAIIEELGSEARVPTCQDEQANSMLEETFHTCDDIPLTNLDENVQDEPSAGKDVTAHNTGESGEAHIEDTDTGKGKMKEELVVEVEKDKKRKRASRGGGRLNDIARQNSQEPGPSNQEPTGLQRTRSLTRAAEAAKRRVDDSGDEGPSTSKRVKQDVEAEKRMTQGRQARGKATGSSVNTKTNQKNNGRKK